MDRRPSCCSASQWLLAQATVARWVQAGDDTRALASALLARRAESPAGGYAFVVVPDHVGAIPFGRNAQGGLMLPPVQATLARRRDSSCRPTDELARWPDLLHAGYHWPPEDASRSTSVAANPLTPKVPPPYALPDHWFCWSPRARALVPVHARARTRISQTGTTAWRTALAAPDAPDARPRLIALNDLSRHHAPLRAELDAAIARVHDRGYYILGPEVEAFEREFAAYCGAASCIAVANGTDALELALRALDIGAGDEVATVANAGRLRDDRDPRGRRGARSTSTSTTRRC